MKATAIDRPPAPGRLEGRHVLAILLGFFTIIFAVNGYFLYSALSTHTGIVANEPYRKGLAYNTRIDAEARQAELNWTDATSIAPDGTVAVAVTGPEGRKVQDLVLTGMISRPSTAQYDRPLRFAEVEPGRYTFAAGVLDSGSWIVAIEGRMSAADKDPIYRARRRLWLTP
jgi:nitrogen fixation protein FixH